jgi:hypothetical protein
MMRTSSSISKIYKKKLYIERDWATGKTTLTATGKALIFA